MQGHCFFTMKWQKSQIYLPAPVLQKKLPEAFEVIGIDQVDAG